MSPEFKVGDFIHKNNGKYFQCGVVLQVLKGNGYFYKVHSGYYAHLWGGLDNLTLCQTSDYCNKHWPLLEFEPEVAIGKFIDRYPSRFSHEDRVHYASGSHFYCSVVSGSPSVKDETEPMYGLQSITRNGLRHECFLSPIPESQLSPCDCEVIIPTPAYKIGDKFHMRCECYTVLDTKWLPHRDTHAYCYRIYSDHPDEKEWVWEREGLMTPCFCDAVSKSSIYQFKFF